MEKTEIKIKTIKRKTLNQQVYESIKESILNGDLPPGVKLFEVQMAKRLGVSATPVREAFRMLASEGLVRIDPWKGAVVQQYSGQETLEATQCRCALESLALRLAYERMGEKLQQAIGFMIAQYDDAENSSEFVQISSAIHDIWVQGSGNHKLSLLMVQLSDVLLHDRNITAKDDARKRNIIQEHKAILEALQAHKIQAAEQALHTHIFNGYEYSIKRINQPMQGNTALE